MNEAETRAEHIDPALKAAGWGVVGGSRIRREVMAPGRLQGKGQRAKAEIADYVLIYRNTKLAVIEAKAWNKSTTDGLAQAKQYARKLAVRFTYATNGQAIYGVDMATGEEGDVAAYPSPTNSGPRPLRNPTPGATASRPYPSRTRAAPGRAATTRRSRSGGCSNPSPTAANASC